MTDSYDLAQLEPNAFEHMVNALALKILGAGHTGFGPGPDGGRDGYFEGEASYPSEIERWSGRWIIQSKFHKPHLSKDPQKWLLEQISQELKLFEDPSSGRVWPDNWIVATNIDPSGAAETGSYDRARKLVAKSRPSLGARFHIWGGRKVLDYLLMNQEVSAYFGHFLTPGHVLAAIYDGITDARAEVSAIIRQLVVSTFEEQRYTRLEQAGSSNDNRPGIHTLFTDLPFMSNPSGVPGMGAAYLARTIAQDHRVGDNVLDSPDWRLWRLSPERARIWFVKGGPGQGKSTLAQYLCQIQRAAVMLGPGGPAANAVLQTVAREVRNQATRSQLWPLSPRVPVAIELKDFAQWLGRRTESQPHGILTYLAERIGVQLEQTVYTGTLKRAFGRGRWMFVFDGLDEVPSDVKDQVANEIVDFIDDVLVGCSADAFHICTSRPQGYSGQFSRLEACGVDLQSLSPDQALDCARPVLQFDRSHDEALGSTEILKQALQSPIIAEIMTTPLQAHIMAVVVRDGGKPPERKWQLFSNFYQVIKKREANRKLPDKSLSKLLLEGDKLLKAVHNRLGFELHKRAERSEGAQTSIKKDEFRKIVQSIVGQLQDADVEETVATLMEATTDRLVLVSTPDSGNEVRFDIRPLQEFFAGEYIYESVGADRLGERMKVIGGDAHWREVMHFLLSALVENDRLTELVVATDVLSEVDEISDAPTERAFHRRMALGGSIASRLLSEGVLEHDKRVRHHFRRCLEPLFATMSGRVLSTLRGVSGRHSLNWLHDVLVTHVAEQNEAESFVAVACLLKTLPDTHPGVDEVRHYLKGSSFAFRSVVFRLARDEPEFGLRQYNPDWCYVAILDALLDHDWMSLGVAGLRASLSTLARAGEATVCRAALLAGLGNKLAKIVSSRLFVGNHDLPKRDSENIREKLGPITLERVKIHDNLVFEEWSDEVWDELSAAPGILHLVYNILKCAKDKSRESIINLRNYLKGKNDIIDALPTYLVSYLPGSSWTLPNWLSDWPHLSDEEITSKYQPYLGHDERLTLHRQECTPAEWSVLIERMPKVAVDLMAFENLGPLSDGARRPEVVIRLIDRCVRNPEVLLSEPRMWRQITQIAPEREEQFRRLLIQAASQATGFVASVSPPYRDREASLMELRLPEEAELLPYSLMLAIATHENPFRPFRGEPELTLTEKVTTLSRIEPLYDIAFDNTRGAGCRSAAAMLYILHRDAQLDFVEQCEQLLITLYLPNAYPWYLRAAAVTLAERMRQGVRETAAVFGQLLVAGRNDFEGRYALEPILERWRERSAAPVLSGPEYVWS